MKTIISAVLLFVVFNLNLQAQQISCKVIKDKPSFLAHAKAGFFYDADFSKDNNRSVYNFQGTVNLGERIAVSGEFAKAYKKWDNVREKAMNEFSKSYLNINGRGTFFFKVDNVKEDIGRIAETLKQKILLSPDFSIVNMATNGKEIIQQLQKDHALEVIIMDINMPEMDGIEATEFITQRWPHIKIIMSTVFDDEQNLFNAIMAGANGYLLKDETPQKIHRSIFEALEGGAPMSQMIARKALSLIKTGRPESSKSEKIDYGLSERETEVLEHLSKGLSYEQIADNLFISYGTVRKHVENIYRKLRVNNRTEAIDKAHKGGLL